MRIADRYDVPWSAYTVAFAGDGERIAIGGGTWYGRGGIITIELASRERQQMTLSNRSASSLRWSHDDRHLLVATWSSSQRAAPAIAVATESLGGLPAASLATGGLGTPTGLVTFGRTAVVRAARADHRDALMIKQWPSELEISTPVQHLTGNRAVVARGLAITGSHLIQLDRGGPLRAGLLVRELGGGPAQHLHQRELQPITAIGITADNTLITGSETGELDQWSWTPAGPVPSRRLGVIPLPIALPDARWITYRPSAVVGICSLEDGRIAAVTAGGMLAISRDNENLAVWQLPVPGTPRSIAAHPDRARVAVGFKRGGFASPESTVAIVELEPEPNDPAWRTERIVALAREAARDPAALEVLADALEALGAPAAVFAHLRRHDPRCRRCWVLDQLTAADRSD